MTSPTNELWSDLYGLLCKYRPIQHGLGALSSDDAIKLDDLAEQIIAKALRASGHGAWRGAGDLTAVNTLADEVVSRVNEYDDRTSPDDFPEALLITSSELHCELVRFAADLAALTPAALERTAGREAVLVKALETALRQWEMYADMLVRDTGLVLAEEKTPEGDLFRQCRATLAAPSPDDQPEKQA